MANMTAKPAAPPWPDLPYADWQDTCTTLHLWTQVVGKIRLAYTPWLNHSWHVTLYACARGLTTSVIPYQPRPFEIVFDFQRHVLDVMTLDGGGLAIPLKPMMVADFYTAVIAALARARYRYENPRAAVRDSKRDPLQSRSRARRL